MSNSWVPADSSGSQPSVYQMHPLDKCLDLRVHPKHVLATNEDSTPEVACADPRLWKRTDVKSWLQWAVGFYQLDSVDATKFAMNGRGLCLLTSGGFMSRAPSCGDVLHGDFQRRYAAAVLKSERERKTKRRLYAMSDWAAGKAKEGKRPKEEDRKDQVP